MRRWTVSLLISAALLTWLWHQMKPGELAETFASLHWPALGTGVLIYLAGVLLRAWRYRTLLNRPIGLWPLVQVTQVRNMLADLLPARIGTASYVYLAVRRFGIDLGDALSSFVSVLFLDLAALAPLLGLALLSLGGVSGSSSPTGFFVLGGGLLILSVAGLLLFPVGLQFLERTVGSGEKNWQSKAGDWIRETRTHYFNLRRRGALWPAFVLSLGVRLAKYGSWYFLLLAVIANRPEAPETLPFPRALVGVLGAELSSTLPVGGLGGFGTYEAAWALGFGAIGFSRSLAVVSGFATHLISQLIDYGLGIAALLYLYKPEGLRRHPGKALAAAVVLLIPLAAFAAPRFWNRWFPPGPGQSAADNREENAFRQAAGMIGRPAIILWSSNRGGDHDLYALELPGGRLSLLTKNPRVDFYSRFSPDGRQVLFLRSREKWVSFRNEEAWDVWVMNRDGRRPRRLAEAAYHPSWWPDGESIIYHRDRRLIRLRLRQAEEEVLADGRREPFEGRIETPYVSPDGQQMAVTIRGRWRGVATWTIGTDSLRPLDRADGCQLGWRPDGSELIWVAGGGRKKNRFLRMPAAGGEPSLLLDMPGPYSHEYFPRVSNDNRFLIFAAAAQGHEHDRADYEIFLWEIGRPPETALRLTWHSGNDQWPDLWVQE